ncbi:serine hydrolase FSH [Apiospora kogelbergensis]|uniref:Serine hydrolase FSH n=1 Tax=Apiospora kogelbergensis TaxID=1337665 RepID=A0AAW0R0Q1_9PEZI
MRHQHLDSMDPTLHLPRILCLHGGGTNSRIFRAQCRVLISQLRPYFRLCFAEAPFSSSAGPDVTSVYKAYTPFRRWLRWQPDHPELETEAAIRAIDESVDAAKLQDDFRGATGEWVGILGFSQGAKVAASLLLRQQMQRESSESSEIYQHGSSTYAFGILLAGRGPLVALDATLPSNGLVDAAELGVPGEMPVMSGKAPRLSIPTIHVHGLRDPNLVLHQQLLSEMCAVDCVRLVEWDGDHRVPVKTKDVGAIVVEILTMAKRLGLVVLA